jgi:predicted Zn-dependent protease
MMHPPTPEQPLGGARGTLLDRRSLVSLALAGALSAPLIACSENPATGRSQFVLVSDAMLERMAAQSWADILRSVPRSSEPEAQRRLTGIGARIAETADLPAVDWEFVVFDSPEINAFVLPGGKVGCYRGLMDLAASDGEIAAVIGHEVGHVMARHAAERTSQQLAVQMSVTAASWILSEDLGAGADLAAAALGAGLVYGLVLPYSRAHELEADRLGVDLMRRADFDAADSVRFWERMVAKQSSSRAPLPWMSTHPANDERLAALRALV